jgi:ribosomal protein S18 acetylase RimI-like enzyme
MATIALGQRIPLVARATADRTALRAFLERDRLFAAYAVADLDEREFSRTRWAMATAGGEPIAVGVEYSGPTPQPLFVMGRDDGIAAILRDVLRPRLAFLAAAPQALPAVGSLYKLDPGPAMIRMAVDSASFRPYPMPEVMRLLPSDVGDLNRLYQLGFAAWLPAGSVEEGIYFGIHVGGRLVAAAGTHVVSREGRIGVVGNVLTHEAYRNRGFAKAVTAAVTGELLRFCDDVVLNVRSDNPPAIAAYAGLGYREHCRFEERLVRRSAPVWPSFVEPLRRLFAPRSAAPAQFSQAHPVAPVAPATSAADGIARPAEES